MAEHRRAVKNKDPKNGIAMHVQRQRIPSTGRKQRSLGGRTIGEEEGFLKPS